MAEVDPAEALIVWTDLAAASRHQALRSRVWVALVPVGILLLAAAIVAPLPVLRLMALFLLLFVASVPLWGPTAATWVQARRRVWPSEPTRWLVADEGLVIAVQGGQSMLPWSSLTECDAWKKGVSLHYGRAVAFLPSRAFSDTSHRDAFVAQVRTSMASSRPEESFPPPSER